MDTRSRIRDVVAPDEENPLSEASSPPPSGEQSPSHEEDFISAPNQTRIATASPASQQQISDVLTQLASLQTQQAESDRMLRELFSAIQSGLLIGNPTAVIVTTPILSSNLNVEANIEGVSPSPVTLSQSPALPPSVSDVGRLQHHFAVVTLYQINV